MEDSFAEAPEIQKVGQVDDAFLELVVDQTGGQHRRLVGRRNASTDQRLGLNDPRRANLAPDQLSVIQ